MRASASRRLSLISNHICVSSPPSSGVFPSHCASTDVPSGQLSGQVAIVTGSGNGIGKAAAELFAKEGAIVVVNDLSKEKSEKVALGIRSSGGQAVAFHGDVTKDGFAEAITKFAFDRFGKLNILVNNAGYCDDGMLHRMTDEQWEAMISIHNTAPFKLIRAAAKYMRDPAKEELKATGRTEPRCIINVSSTSGLHGNVGQANYATAKLGIVGLTKTVAKEWGLFGIRCNAIAFGLIDTRLTQAKGKDNYIEVGGRRVQLGIPTKSQSGDRTAHIPLRRVGTVEDAAGGVLLLASPHASYITGHCLEVTGGVGI